MLLKTRSTVVGPEHCKLEFTCTVSACSCTPSAECHWVTWCAQRHARPGGAVVHKRKQGGPAFMECIVWRSRQILINYTISPAKGAGKERSTAPWEHVRAALIWFVWSEIQSLSAGEWRWTGCQGQSVAEEWVWELWDEGPEFADGGWEETRGIGAGRARASDWKRPCRASKGRACTSWRPRQK